MLHDLADRVWRARNAAWDRPFKDPDPGLQQGPIPRPARVIGGTAHHWLPGPGAARPPRPSQPISSPERRASCRQNRHRSARAFDARHHRARGRNGGLARRILSRKRRAGGRPGLRERQLEIADRGALDHLTGIPPRFDVICRFPHPTAASAQSGDKPSRPSTVMTLRLVSV